MKKRLVLPTVYFLITVAIFVGILYLGSTLSFQTSGYDYSIDSIVDNSFYVEGEDETASVVIEKPTDVEVATKYYSREAEEVDQQNSLIFYDDTYMPNTGLLYASEETFEVKTVFAGMVTDIKDDDFFGKYVVVEHSENIKTVYYGLTELEVNIGDELTTGAVLGKSNNNAIMNDKYTTLLEVYNNNTLINPDTFIGTKITDYN